MGRGADRFIRRAHRGGIPYRGECDQSCRGAAAGGLRFRDLRHSYTTWLVDDGVPINMVQRVMGHERSSTALDLYTRRTDASERILQVLGDGGPS
jgi:integrase